MRMRGLGIWGVLVAAGAAWGQTEITIGVEQPVLMPGQSTLVTLWAGHAPEDWEMALVGTEFVSSAGAEGLSDWSLVEPMSGPGTLPGEAGTSGIEGILAGQLNFPPGHTGENPIAFWRVRYTAPGDAMPMDVQFSTVTSRYEVYATRESVFGESRLGELTEGAATIRVVPAPPGLLVLAAGGCLVRRRRSLVRGSRRQVPPGRRPGRQG